jgi:hypothetical protein
MCLAGSMLFDTALEAQARRFLRGPDFGMAYGVTMVLILTLISSLLDRFRSSRSPC